MYIYKYILIVSFMKANRFEKKDWKKTFQEGIKYIYEHMSTKYKQVFRNLQFKFVCYSIQIQ